MDEPVGVTEGTAEAMPEGPDLEAVMDVMWNRIESLEGERRKLRRVAVAGVAIAAVAIGIAALRTPEERDLAAPFVLQDAAGRVRARLAVDSTTDQAVLRMFAADGAEQVSLASSGSGPVLTLSDAKRSSALRLVPGGPSPIVDVADRDRSVERRAVAPAPVAVPVADTAAAIRRPRVIETRGSSLWFPPQRRSRGSGYCHPGTLGCQRISRTEQVAPEG